MDQNIALLLARMDSKRLPGKHFEKIGDESLIMHCFNRLKQGKNYEIVLATSNRKVDDPLADWAKEQGVKVFRGDAADIKKRIKDCVISFNAQRFARVNADSPFVDAALLDKGFRILEESSCDLVTNLLPRSFPYGYSVEVFNAVSFIAAIADNKEMENVSTFFYENAAKFKIENIQLKDKDYSKISLTVDTREDLERMRELYSFDNRIFDLKLEELIEVITKIKTDTHD
jgi:spore coat polysaccharide biosynthesis protein SpsF